MQVPLSEVTYDTYADILGTPPTMPPTDLPSSALPEVPQYTKVPRNRKLKKMQADITAMQVGMRALEQNLRTFMMANNERLNRIDKHIVAMNDRLSRVSNITSTRGLYISRHADMKVRIDALQDQLLGVVMDIKDLKPCPCHEEN
jgi:septation ring formation regulator EzrA